MQDPVVAHAYEGPSGSDTRADPREEIRATIAHFEHVLPGQAPIKDFVHHNTLHGFQHLPFPEALRASRELTGIHGYLPEEQFRALYAQGRITREDLDHVLDDDPDLVPAAIVGAPIQGGQGTLSRRDVYIAALLHPLRPVTACQLTWQIEELDALRAFQPDVASASRERLLRQAASQDESDEAATIGGLWSACLEVLSLEHYLVHPEDITDLSPEQAERMLSSLMTEGGQTAAGGVMQRVLHKESEEVLSQLLHRVGDETTLRGLLLALTGRDILEELRPTLLRHLAAHLDQGMAAWHNPDRARGLYAAWRESAARDLAPLLEDLPDWYDHLGSLPEDALGAIVAELTRLMLPREQWAGYLEKLALELPGWSGMLMWRSLRPGYAGLADVPVDMADYLAVRLTLERLYARRLSRELWGIEATLGALRRYFHHHRAELLVRHALFNTRLPEYLASQAQGLVERAHAGSRIGEESWKRLAHLIWTWRQSPAADRPAGRSVFRSAWPLFRLSQHLGLCGADIRALDRQGTAAMLDCLDQLDAEHAGLLWLQAYERHYREQLFNALADNHGRGAWARRDVRPDAQVVFCMDDREEGIRRHLEEVNPSVETLGAAGFFGVPINWRGLDDETVTPLCPVVVRPSHELREVVAAGEAARASEHRRRRAARLRIKDLLFQESRRNLVSGSLLAGLGAPGALAALAGKILAPRAFSRLTARLRERFDPPVVTRVAIDAPDDGSAATPEHNRLGLTDTEQAAWVQSFLRVIGVLEGFAPVVILMGHGSISQNNPHLAAYDCGACSGRHGGPNARAFAAMANRPEVRELLRGRGIAIPEDCWLVGAEHNTCDESILWYDLDLVPAPLRPSLEKLQADIAQATLGSAQERCRRFASAPDDPAPRRALAHVAGRAVDFSQARPELGHATNAAALIGRRSMSRGVFFDRRAFLISYDPNTDPEGAVLENILLAVGPVGAGINLEYYFSTVSNDRYGCGTKVLHNVTGSFAVMEGASSDLRTGLPRQMISIHEAMRLQVVVEHRTEVIARLYERQPPLQELIGNGWILLSAIDPDTGAISIFRPGTGFVPWRGPDGGELRPLPVVARSSEWYAGHRDPLPPALIAPSQEQEDQVAHA